MSNPPCISEPGIESVGVYAIHEHAYFGVVIDFTVSTIHQSTGNDMLDLVQAHKILEDESSLLAIIEEYTQIELELGDHVSDILWTKKEVLEEKGRIPPVLNIVRWFGRHPNCSLPKEAMQYIPQKNYVNGKVILERAIFGLLHMGTHISRFDDQGTVYLLLIIGGVIWCVIFIGTRNKDFSHTIHQEVP